MSLINNFSMQGKLLALVIPALLVVVYFAAHQINDNYGDLANMRELQAMVRLVDTGDPLAEALQQERDRSLVFFASVYAPEEAEKALATQRGQTDTRITVYRSKIDKLMNNINLDEDMRANIQAFNGELESLSSLRQSVDDRSVEAGEINANFTGKIMALIGRVSLIVRRSSDAGLTRQVGTYFALAQAVEMAGRERATGASLLRRGNFELPVVETIAQLAGQQKALFSNALSMLPTDSKTRQTLENFSASAANNELLAKRKTLFKSPSGLYGLEAEDWFADASGRINALNNMRADLLQRVTKLSDEGVSRAMADLTTASAIALASIVVALALMLVIMRSIKLQVSNLLAGVRQAMERKDLSQAIPVTSKDEIGSIITAINELFRRFGEALTHIDKASMQLATATGGTATTANQNVNQIRSQQLQIEQAAAATEQMSTTSEEISRNTQQVADAASNATDKSRIGETVLHGSINGIRTLAASVQQVNSVIEELEERSGSISEVVHVIRQVADQTNLLALNAAIEAARAGEHGRGFAVVADEVRALASQTHESTTKIEGIINNFRDVTENATRSISASYKLANETSAQTAELEQTFADIISDVNGISDMAGQIATASEEQVAVTRELSGSMEAVSETALLTLTGSEEINEVAGEQARLARQLKEMANEFKV